MEKLSARRRRRRRRSRRRGWRHLEIQVDLQTRKLDFEFFIWFRGHHEIILATVGYDSSPLANSHSQIDDLIHSR